MQDSIDLNNYVYHGIGVYLEPFQKIGRLLSILESGAILSESSQPRTFEFANRLSPSPKLNGKDNISICQRESFVETQTISESFDLFVSSGLSIILDKRIIESLNAENCFDPKHKWRWLDGEYRVKDKIPSEYFVGIGFPSHSLEDTAQSYKNIRKNSLRQCRDNIINSKWYKDYCTIKNSLNYNNVALPIYSIISGKLMGDLYLALSEVFQVSVDEVKETFETSQSFVPQRVGVVKDWTSSWSMDMDDDTLSR